MGEKHDDARRVAELEAEVARLRQRLGEAEGPAKQPGGSPVGPAAGGSEQPLGKASRGKVIGLAVAIVLCALIAFAAIFMALSQGFDSLAKKAAKSLIPATEGSSSGSAGGHQRPIGPMAPGL